VRVKERASITRIRRANTVNDSKKLDSEGATLRVKSSQVRSSEDLKSPAVRVVGL